MEEQYDVDANIFFNNSLDSLSHFGVSGMKWGVRNEDTLRKYNGAGKFLGKDRSKDIHIYKGTKAYRVSTENEKLRSGQTYVHLDKEDHAIYLQDSAAGNDWGFIARGNDTNGNQGRPYSLQFKLTQDVIAPSYHETMDSFIKTFSDVKTKDILNYAEFKNKQENKMFIKNFRKLNIDEARDKAYIQFVSTFMQNSEAKKAFFNDLKRKGYNAIIDENDVKFGKGYGKSPMIMFEADKTLTKTKSIPVSQKDEDIMRDYFWNNTDPYMSVKDLQKKTSISL